MTEQMILQLMRELAQIVLLLSGPLLMVSLGVGLIVSILQVVSSIHDPTLSFVPRIVAVVVVALLTLPWMLDKIMGYTSRLLAHLANYAH